MQRVGHNPAYKPTAAPTLVPLRFPRARQEDVGEHGHAPTSYGLQRHPNCHDTIGEAIGEFGLTPDDTHEPFCLWMNATWSSRGDWNPSAGRVPGKPGDHADLLATMDVVAVPVICGGADLFVGTGNYKYKPVRIEVFEKSPQTTKVADDYVARYALKSRPSVSNFRVRNILAERELHRTPDFVPKFIDYPIEWIEVPIELTDQGLRDLMELQAEGLGDDDEDSVRSAVVEWYAMNRSRLKFGQ